MFKTKTKIGTRVMSIFMSLLMAASMLTVLLSVEPAEEVSAANDYGLVDNVQQGQILQCFDWSYNNMKANMQKIAEQGFSAVQTSPIQQAKEGTKGQGGGKWWVYYQPAYWRIDDTGNSALGTKAEFKAMVDEAHKYGVKVIVDAVLNHTGNISDAGGIAPAVDPDIRNDSSCWHTTDRSTGNYNDRWEVTQLMMGGLPDLNTGHQKVQNKSIEFLKECIDCGVDGFRFDGTKHIETPDEAGDYKSDFWPNVLGAASSHAQSKGKTLFYYGEILDAVGGSLSVTSYTKYMSITDNEASDDVRNAVNERNASGAARSSMGKGKSGLAPSKAVWWNESHDTWAHTQGATSGWASTKVINQTWAMVGARNEVCGMYLARPHGTNETNCSTPLGNAETDTGWANPEVKAINQFKNSMVGESEYFSSEGSFAYNERGTKGVVIINCNNGSASVNLTAHKMQDGTYTDQISGNQFTVSGGKISGQMGDTGIAVVYNPGSGPVRGGVSATPADGTTFTDTLTVTLKASNVTDAKYTTSEGASGSYTDGQTITVGSSTSVGSTVTVTLSGKKSDGTEVTASYKYTKKDPNAITSIYFDNSSYNWSSVYAYIYKGEGETAEKVAAWPGTAMTKDSTSGFYKLDVPDGFENGKVMFTESETTTTNRYPADGMPGLDIGGKSMIFKAGNKWEEYSNGPIPSEPTVTVDRATGTEFTTETLNITLGLKNAVSGTYSVDDGPVKNFTGSTTVKIGEGKIGDSTVTVKTTAKGSDGTTKSYTFTYKKVYVKKTTNAKAAVASAASSRAAAGTLSSKYSTNGTGVGKSKTITVDGSVSDWDSSMLIARGAANDDPRVYRPNSMYEIPYDAYSLYGAWDDTNLYLMIEMTNVQDVVAPNDNHPLSNNVSTDCNVPMFIYIDTGKSDAIGNNGKTQDGGMFWAVNTTVSNSFNRLIAISTKPGANGPYVYGGDSTGINPVELSNSTTSGIVYKTGKGIVSSEVWGIDKAYGEHNNRVVGDICNDSADWVDFNTKGHNSSTMDFNYEISIPLTQLGITKSDIENNGIGVLYSLTSGLSGMDCLPYDLSMNDNADQSDPGSNPENSFEKGDTDNITTSFARLGKGGDGPTPPVPPDPTLPLQVNFGADRSAPQEAGTALTLKGIGYGGSGSGYKYEFIVDGETVQASSTSNSYSWNLTGGSHTIECKITDSKGNTATSSKTYTGEGDTPVTPLKNNSTVSATSITYGNTVTFTGRASGGESPYKYRFEAQHSTASSYTILKDYNDTGSTKSWKPSKTGTYTLRATVKDSDGDTLSKTFTLTVKAATTTLNNNSTISATSIAYGNTVTFTGKASGGTSPYKYRFAAKHSTASSYTILKDYDNTATTKVWKPSKTGTYTLLVRVKDKAGKEAAKTFTLTVKNALANASTISATSVVYGNTVTFTGKATGGAGSYKYRFAAKHSTASSYTILKDYDNTATTKVWKPSKTGTYTLLVRVKDKAGKEAAKTFTLTVKNALTNASTISATSVVYGNTVTFTGKATGGAGSYKYRFAAKHSTAASYTILKDYDNTATTKVWKPSKTGKYTLLVRVKDKAGKVASKEYTLTVNKALANASTISATSVVYGNTVTFTGKATGGAGTYKYRFAAKHSTAASYTILKDYDNTATTKVWKPSKTGKYTLLVRVKDKAGKVASKEYTLTVNKALANASTISATSVAYGNTVTFTGKATGGAGTYKYRFAAKHSTASAYTILKDYDNTATTKVWKPSKTGTYKLLIRVKDKAGKVASKEYTLAVKNSLANASTISATSIDFGKTITFTGKATGGAGSYKYRFAAKHSTASAYTILKDYDNTATTKVWKPTKTGTYKLLVRVKDKAGIVSSKEYTLTVKAVLTNNSKISATTAKVNQNFKITSSATGGTAPYTYTYYNRVSNPDNAWVQLSTTSSTCTRYFTKAGKYDLAVRITDAKGATAIKYFTVTVTN